jgi:heme A synthase
VSTRAYRRLAVATLVATFLLIILGGIVRVSGSGLGCGPEGSGFHGWPFCNGDIVPGFELTAVIEYAHRIVAGIVGVMIVLLFVLAVARRVEGPRLPTLTGALVVLVAAQAGLGGLTVEKGLDEGLVAAHLGLAMVLLGGLLLLVRMCGARFPSDDGGPTVHNLTSNVPRPLKALAALTALVMLATIVAGGYMAGTENYGRPDYRLGDGAHHACGKEFPTCNGSFMPFGESRLVDIHLTHRAFMYLAVLLTVMLMAAVLRRRKALSAAAVARARWLGALVAVQVLLGALNVWLDEYELLIVAHLAVGTLVWAVALDLALSLAPVRAVVRGRVPGDATLATAAGVK